MSFQPHFRRYFDAEKHYCYIPKSRSKREEPDARRVRQLRRSVSEISVDASETIAAAATQTKEDAAVTADRLVQAGELVKPPRFTAHEANVIGVHRNMSMRQNKNYLNDIEDRMRRDGNICYTFNVFPSCPFITFQQTALGFLFGKNDSSLSTRAPPLVVVCRVPFT